MKQAQNSSNNNPVQNSLKQSIQQRHSKQIQQENSHSNNQNQLKQLQQQQQQDLQILKSEQLRKHQYIDDQQQQQQQNINFHHQQQYEKNVMASQQQQNKQKQQQQQQYNTGKSLKQQHSNYIHQSINNTQSAQIQKLQELQKKNPQNKQKYQEFIQLLNNIPATKPQNQKQQQHNNNNQQQQQYNNMQQFKQQQQNQYSQQKYQQSQRQFQQQQQQQQQQQYKGNSVNQGSQQQLQSGMLQQNRTKYIQNNQDLVTGLNNQLVGIIQQNNRVMGQIQELQSEFSIQNNNQEQQQYSVSVNGNNTNTNNQNQNQLQLQQQNQQQNQQLQLQQQLLSGNNLNNKSSNNNHQDQTNETNNKFNSVTRDQMGNEFTNLLNSAQVIQYKQGSDSYCLSNKIDQLSLEQKKQLFKCYMHEQIILDKSIKNTLENMQLSKEKSQIGHQFSLDSEQFNFRLMVQLQNCINKTLGDIKQLEVEIQKLGQQYYHNQLQQQQQQQQQNQQQPQQQHQQQQQQYNQQQKHQQQQNRQYMNNNNNKDMQNKNNKDNISKPKGQLCKYYELIGPKSAAIKYHSKERGQLNDITKLMIENHLDSKIKKEKTFINDNLKFNIAKLRKALEKNSTAHTIKKWVVQEEEYNSDDENVVVKLKQNIKNTELFKKIQQITTSKKKQLKQNLKQNPLNQIISDHKKVQINMIRENMHISQQVDCLNRYNTTLEKANKTLIEQNVKAQNKCCELKKDVDFYCQFFKKYHQLVKVKNFKNLQNLRDQFLNSFYLETQFENEDFDENIDERMDLQQYQTQPSRKKDQSNNGNLNNQIHSNLEQEGQYQQEFQSENKLNSQNTDSQFQNNNINQQVSQSEQQLHFMPNNIKKQLQQDDDIQKIGHKNQYYDQNFQQPQQGLLLQGHVIGKKVKSGNKENLLTKQMGKMQILKYINKMGDQILGFKNKEQKQGNDYMIKISRSLSDPIDYMNTDKQYIYSLENQKIRRKNVRNKNKEQGKEKQNSNIEDDNNSITQQKQQDDSQQQQQQTVSISNYQQQNDKQQQQQDQQTIYNDEVKLLNDINEYLSHQDLNISKEFIPMQTGTTYRKNNNINNNNQ